MTSDTVKIIECPRDAMQGIRHFISTEKKVTYINQLLKVGFHSIDFGSFVSPDMIPQMADTAEVLEKLNTTDSLSKLIAIVANERGATEACSHAPIQALGYPFSLSETFQQRNTNASISDSYDRVKKIADTCNRNNKELIIYLSMGFGNPYGDAYDPDIVESWIDQLQQLNINTFMLSDTIGVANPELVGYLFTRLHIAFPGLEIGAHFHTAPHNWLEKVEAAYAHGCRRFDSALKGYGGCPMAKDELIGNMPTENLLNFFKPAQHHLNMTEFENALRMVPAIFTP